ncbi:hypothetical protein BDAP_002843 [Binucleata daphniae]
MLSNDILPEFLYIDAKGDICNRYSQFKMHNDHFTVTLDNKLVFYDFRTTEIIAQIVIKKKVRISAYTEFTNENTKYCAIGFENGTVYIYTQDNKDDNTNNIKTDNINTSNSYALQIKFKAHNKRIYNIHNYKNQIIIVSHDGMISNFDLHTEKLFYYTKSKKTVFLSVLHNKKLYANCSEQAIKVWNIDNEENSKINDEQNNNENEYIKDSSNEIDNDLYNTGNNTKNADYLEDCYFFSSDIHLFVPYSIFLIIVYASGETEIYNTKTKTSKKFSTFKNCYDAKVIDNKLYIMTKGKFYVYKIEEKVTQSNVDALKSKTICNSVVAHTNIDSKRNDSHQINIDSNNVDNNTLQENATLYNFELKLQNESAIQIDKQYWIFEIKNEKILFAGKNTMKLYYYKKVNEKHNNIEKTNTAVKNSIESQNNNTKSSNEQNSAHFVLLPYKNIEYHKNEIFDIFMHKNKVYTISEDKIIVWNIYDNKINKQNIIEFDYKATSAFMYDNKIFVHTNERIYVYNATNGNLIVSKEMKNKKIKNYENKMYSCIEDKLEIHEIDSKTDSKIDGKIDTRSYDKENRNEEKEFDKNVSDKSMFLKKIYEHKFDDTIVFISVSSIFYGVSLLNNKIILFDRKTNDQKLILYGHSLPVFYFTFSFDNKQILSCGSDKLLKLWGTDFGECIKSFVGNCKNVEFVTNNSFIYADKEIKYVYKNKVIKEYKGFDQRIVKYNKKYMIVATKYGIKAYKVGEYEMIVKDSKLKEYTGDYKNNKYNNKYNDNSEFESSSEIDDLMVKETQILNYKKFEYFMNELEKEETNNIEILNCIKNLDFGEIDKFVYFLSEMQIRNVLKVIKHYCYEFPILMGRFLDYIIKIHSYLCEYDNEIHEIYTNIREGVEKVRNEMGCNLYILDE